MESNEESALGRLAGGVIVGGFDGSSLPPVVRERLARGHLAGVTLFRRNITDVSGVRALCASILSSVGADTPSPIISIDQEGGRVARLKERVTLLPPMRVLGAIDDIALTCRAARIVGDELAAMGVNLNFAPVCDVDSNSANPIIGDRAFGRSTDLVSRHVAAFLEGLRDAGVMGCAKHFPGHGDTETDSHLALPRIRHDRAHLEAVELPPFRAAVRAGVASIMSAHVLFDALDAEVPATLSHTVMTGLLRNDIAKGSDAVIFSDDLHMAAVSDRWTVEESSVLAIAAGCDGLLICTDPDAQERARLALITRARRDAAFATRLRDASERVTRMRRLCRVAPAPDDHSLAAVLDRPSHRALIEELQSRQH
jgi:beta-N-acetylhexosaminidase